MDLLCSKSLPSAQSPFNTAPLNSAGTLSQSALPGEDSAVSAPRHLAFVDTGLSDVEMVAGFEDTQVVLIESGQDGIAHMTAALSEYNNFCLWQLSVRNCGHQPRREADSRYHSR